MFKPELLFYHDQSNGYPTAPEPPRSPQIPLYPDELITSGSILSLDDLRPWLDRSHPPQIVGIQPFRPDSSGRHRPGPHLVFNRARLEAAVNFDDTFNRTVLTAVSAALQPARKSLFQAIFRYTFPSQPEPLCFEPHLHHQIQACILNGIDRVTHTSPDASPLASFYHQLALLLNQALKEDASTTLRLLSPPSADSAPNRFNIIGFYPTISRILQSHIPFATLLDASRQFSYNDHYIPLLRSGSRTSHLIVDNLRQYTTDRATVQAILLEIFRSTPGTNLSLLITYILALHQHSSHPDTSQPVDLNTPAAQAELDLIVSDNISAPPQPPSVPKPNHHPARQYIEVKPPSPQELILRELLVNPEDYGLTIDWTATFMLQELPDQQGQIALTPESISQNRQGYYQYQEALAHALHAKFVSENQIDLEQIKHYYPRNDNEYPPTLPRARPAKNTFRLTLTRDFEYLKNQGAWQRWLLHPDFQRAYLKALPFWSGIPPGTDIFIDPQGNHHLVPVWDTEKWQQFYQLSTTRDSHTRRLTRTPINHYPHYYFVSQTSSKPNPPSWAFEPTIITHFVTSLLDKGATIYLDHGAARRRLEDPRISSKANTTLALRLLDINTQARYSQILGLPLFAHPLCDVDLMTDGRTFSAVKEIADQLPGVESWTMLGASMTRIAYAVIAVSPDEYDLPLDPHQAAADPHSISQPIELHTQGNYPTDRVVQTLLCMTTTRAFAFTPTRIDYPLSSGATVPILLDKLYDPFGATRYLAGPNSGVLINGQHRTVISPVSPEHMFNWEHQPVRSIWFLLRLITDGPLQNGVISPPGTTFEYQGTPLNQLQPEQAVRFIQEGSDQIAQTIVKAITTLRTLAVRTALGETRTRQDLEQELRFGFCLASEANLLHWLTLLSQKGTQFPNLPHMGKLLPELTGVNGIDHSRFYPHLRKAIISSQRFQGMWTRIVEHLADQLATSTLHQESTPPPAISIFINTLWNDYQAFFRPFVSEEILSPHASALTAKKLQPRTATAPDDPFPGCDWAVLCPQIGQWVLAYPKEWKQVIDEFNSTPGLVFGTWDEAISFFRQPTRPLYNLPEPTALRTLLEDPITSPTRYLELTTRQLAAFQNWLLDPFDF